MAPTDEQELSDRALKAAHRLAADLERDGADPRETAEGSRAARAVAEAARRLANELQSARTEETA